MHTAARVPTRSLRRSRHWAKVPMRSPSLQQRPWTPSEQGSRYPYVPPPQESQGLGMKSVAVELPGDFHYGGAASESQHPQPPPYYPIKRDPSVSGYSGTSPDVNTGRWSDNQKGSDMSRPDSYISDASGGHRSPVTDPKSFTAELPVGGENKVRETNVNPRPANESWLH